MRRFAFVALLVGAACEDKKPGAGASEVPADPSGLAQVAALGADAGALGEAALLDPPAPAGDLKAELDRFVNVETCVAERAKLDPLVGDALGAIGYETLLRDACRLLEAAKDKKRESCDKIDSSALRARCQSWVAIVAQAPDGCPMQFEGVVTRGRDASCIAVASKDPRLCAAEGRANARATCEAMTLRDPAKCDALLGGQRSLCQREVARWRGVLASPLEGLEKLPASKGKLVLRGTNGTADPTPAELDVGADFVRGVVVVTSGGGGTSALSTERRRIEIGTVVESEIARIAAIPQKRARIGTALLFERAPGAKSVDPPKATIQKLELELPAEAPLVSPPVSCDCRVTVKKLAEQRGGEIALSIEGTLAGGTRSYRVSFEVVTFVRDVLPESLSTLGNRVLPAIHPPVRSGSR